MEALELSRVAVIVLDMHTDVKGYSLFTLPQVRSVLLFNYFRCFLFPFPLIRYTNWVFTCYLGITLSLKSFHRTRAFYGFTSRTLEMCMLKGYPLLHFELCGSLSCLQIFDTGIAACKILYKEGTRTFWNFGHQHVTLLP